MMVANHVDTLRAELNDVLAEITARNAGNTLGLFPETTLGQLNKTANLLRLELADSGIEARHQERNRIDFQNRRRNAQRFN